MVLFACNGPSQSPDVLDNSDLLRHASGSCLEHVARKNCGGENPSAKTLSTGSMIDVLKHLNRNLTSI